MTAAKALALDPDDIPDGVLRPETEMLLARTDPHPGGMAALGRGRPGGDLFALPVRVTGDLQA